MLLQPGLLDNSTLYSTCLKCFHAFFQPSVGQKSFYVSAMVPVFWPGVVWSTQTGLHACWQELQTLGETTGQRAAPRHTFSSDCLVMTDRQQTHQVPVRVHQESSPDTLTHSLTHSFTHSLKHKGLVLWYNRGLYWFGSVLVPNNA